MIRRQRPDETQFRHGPGGREPLAPPGAGGDHVHYTPKKSVGIGCITSRRDPATFTQLSFFEQLAFELKCSVATARKLFDEGLIK